MSAIPSNLFPDEQQMQIKTLHVQSMDYSFNGDGGSTQYPITQYITETLSFIGPFAGGWTTIVTKNLSERLGLYNITSLFNTQIMTGYNSINSNIIIHSGEAVTPYMPTNTFEYNETKIDLRYIFTGAGLNILEMQLNLPSLIGETNLLRINIFVKISLVDYQ